MCLAQVMIGLREGEPFLNRVKEILETVEVNTTGHLIFFRHLEDLRIIISENYFDYIN